MIGVVGHGGTADRVVRRLRDADERVVTGAAEEVIEAGPSAVVAVGEAALVDLVWAGLDAPALPVGSAPGFPAVRPSEAPTAAERLAAGEIETRNHRLLAVAVDGGPVGPAALDVLLVRAEPGRISEYGVAAGGTRSRFRADGVVVATPAGSYGYAHAAGGPQLALDATAVTVVPVAPFGLGTPSWVFDPAGGVELTVERDEGDVSVRLDGRGRRRLTGRSTVTLEPGDVLRTVVPP